jgi:ribose-phosphate pyrophosphokinase
MQVLGFKDYHYQAKRLASVLDADYREIEVHHFPDGESKVTLPENLETEIVICRSLDHPNDKLIELLLSCAMARRHGVKKIILVAPYLCYMRQDTAFKPGEAVSQKIIGRWLGELFDHVITVDPHLHRISDLDVAIPKAETTVLSATTLMAQFLQKRPSPPVLLGPDMESEQWVKQIASLTKLEWAVATKTRHSDHRVDITLPEFDFSDRTVVIVDDVVSTGRTIAQAARELKQAGARTIDCLVTHPLFVDDAEQVLANALIAHIWSSDSINHNSNIIQLAELLADAIRH